VEAAPAEAPKGTVRRAAVRETIQRGLGVFLQNVTLEDWPAMKDGKFHGFRLKAVRADWGVDLRPGDVVTRVNGMPIERPEQADAAMRSLENAKSIRVDLERDGAPRVLEIPIVD
jgi:type II secretory pathway component PulC